MTKAEIIDEIKWLATADGGNPPGQTRFASETGLPRSAWSGKYWARWGDALIEAGFEPKLWGSAYDDDLLIETFAAVIREIGRYPTSREISIHARNHPGFPTYETFRRRGTKVEFAKAVIEWCQSRSGYDDVIQICTPIAEIAEPREKQSSVDVPAMGCVYLLKSGRYYKVGHTNAAARREYELRMQMPEKASIVHKFETDDPPGIEAYWHKRFAEKRLNGEWFALSAEDVRAFKRRRKFM